MEKPTSSFEQSEWPNTSHRSKELERVSQELSLRIDPEIFEPARAMVVEDLRRMAREQSRD